MHEEKKQRYDVNDTFAINIVFVLDPEQIGRSYSYTMELLTFLNSPRGKFMKDGTLKRIEDSIGGTIRDE